MSRQENTPNLKIIFEIPTFARNELAKKSVRSALVQSRPPDEIRVVEKSGTKEIFNWEEKGKVRITRNEHRGVTLLCSGVAKKDRIRIGRDTYINRGTMLDAHNKIWIGERVMVGPGCYITDSDHGMKLGVPVKDQPMTLEEVVIEDEAWIGAKVTILKNVRIGRGAIVAAGAVVTKDVKPDEVVAGIPAKLMGKRD